MGSNWEKGEETTTEMGSNWEKGEETTTEMGSNWDNWCTNEEISAKLGHRQDKSTVLSSSTISDDIQRSESLPQPPPEFLCPISRRLMSDPVTLPTGQTFDRRCILACIDLGVDPTSLLHEDDCPLHLKPNVDTPLTPNLTLKSLILNWCNFYDVGEPPAIDKATAIDIVRNLVAGSTTVFSSSSALSCEVVEKGILRKLTSFEDIENTEGLLLLRRATKEQKQQRTLLCTQNVLSSLKPFLVTENPILRSNAIAAVVNLSLEHANKSSIVKSGIVPALISSLNSSHCDVRSHAAATLFSLANFDDNKQVIGKLSALPPLLHILSNRNEVTTTRRDAAVALYHLTNNCSPNRSNLLKLGAAKVLSAVIREESTGSEAELERKLGKAVMVLTWYLASTVEGRSALMDSGVVEATTAILGSVSKERNEHCLVLLCRMCKEKKRFREAAAKAGTEEVVAELVGREAEWSDDGKGNVKELAMRILRVTRGEDVDGGGMRSKSAAVRGVEGGGREMRAGVNSSRF